MLADRIIGSGPWIGKRILQLSQFQTASGPGGCHDRQRGAIPCPTGTIGPPWSSGGISRAGESGETQMTCTPFGDRGSGYLP